MTHPEQIIALAGEATRMENEQLDAAALLIDAAALLACEAGTGSEQLIERLKNSHEMFSQTQDMANFGHVRPS